MIILTWKTKAIKDIQEIRKSVDNLDFNVGDRPKEIYDKIDKLENKIHSFYKKWPIWYGEYNLKSKDLELQEWVDDILEDLDSFGQYISDYRNPDELENPNEARPENDPLDKSDIGRWENNHWPDIQDRTDWIIEKLRSD